MKTTLEVMGNLADLKISVYKNNKIYKIYSYPEFSGMRIPVYAGQKIEFIYKEYRSWIYDDKNYKTHYLKNGETLSIIVPLSAQGDATIFFTDRYSDWFISFHGAIGEWIDEALIDSDK